MKPMDQLLRAGYRIVAMRLANGRIELTAEWLAGGRWETVVKSEGVDVDRAATTALEYLHSDR